MKIHPNLTIEQVVNEFSSKFPGLKLELYSEEHKEGENSAPSSMLDHSKKLKEINPSLSEVELILDPQMKVADLENEFKNTFGLNVQVFRRSNKLWLQTSATDNWTLEVQNRKGQHSVQD